jgi:hypothetical protein
MKFIASIPLFILFAVLWLGFIHVAIKLSPEQRVIDCRMAEFHPDFTAEMKKACREQRRIKK